MNANKLNAVALITAAAAMSMAGTGGCSFGIAESVGYRTAPFRYTGPWNPKPTRRAMRRNRHKQGA